MTRDISSKTNRVLNIILLGLILIFIRVWYLSIVQHDLHVEKARRPQRHLSIEKVERGVIEDRFGIPLAVNQIQYNAGVCYADIRSIPSVKWDRSVPGKPKKIYARLEHIKKLSALLSESIGVSQETIEDTIHGKAALFPHTPFILKEGISEALYYRLKMLEKDWQGIYTERGITRIYPQNSVGSDIIGYLGSISAKEYTGIAQEIHELEAYLEERDRGGLPLLPKGFKNPLEVRERFKQLKEKSYTIHDLVGKTGIESTCDEELKGYVGKRLDAVDIKGNTLGVLPGHQKAIPGQKVTLSISSELQAFAEQLLIENETIREKGNALEQPWIKGGAIVALDPHSGEVLALASYPRFNPNDFIPSGDEKTREEKRKAVRKWIENETYVGEIWDGSRPLERERFDRDTGTFYEETLFLGWEEFLSAILPRNSQVRVALSKIDSLSGALFLQEELSRLLTACAEERLDVLINALYSDKHHLPSHTAVPLESVEKIKNQLARTPLARGWIDMIFENISANDDKLLLIDLCRMLVKKDLFPPALLEAVGDQSFAVYRQLSQKIISFQKQMQPHVKKWFHEKEFIPWRKEHFAKFLKKKREEEKEQGKYARPYTDYVELIEKQHFRAFWEKERLHFLEYFLFGKGEIPSLYQDEISQFSIPPEIESIRSKLSHLSFELKQAYLKTLRSFEELSSPLVGRYKNLRNTQGVQLEKHLAAAFYPLAGFGLGRSQAFRQSTPLGSVFKVVVAYEALLERYQQIKEHQIDFLTLNPLTLIDDLKACPKDGNKQILGFTPQGNAILRLHKGGKLPRSHPNIGKIDLLGALEQSSNLYFALLASEYIETPLNLIETCKSFGFGEKSGLELPGEIGGVLPGDLLHNKTGLYAFAIGQHSLVVTPLQTAVMLSAIAGKGEVLKPKIIQAISGGERTYSYSNPFEAPSSPYQKALEAIGLSFPLFTASEEKQSDDHLWVFSKEVRKTLPMPSEITSALFNGMHRVISGTKGTARPAIIRLLYQDPLIREHFFTIKDQLIGKTGTAEILFKQTIDAESTAKIHNHIWFGGISFKPDTKLYEPELVVVVYLRFSEAGGKEAAPLATEMIHKWREIQARHK